MFYLFCGTLGTRVPNIFTLFKREVFRSFVSLIVFILRVRLVFTHAHLSLHCLTLCPVVTLCCRARPNLLKNRYTDVLCYDHTRVLLAQSDKDPMSDYIHANFVDGYKQKNAFISTQGPLPHTCADFWRMIWEQQVLVIVMTTKVFECGKIKCEQYWPSDETSDDLTYQNFRVSTTLLSQFDNYCVTRLEVTNTNVSTKLD